MTDLCLKTLTQEDMDAALLEAAGTGSAILTIVQAGLRN